MLRRVGFAAVILLFLLSIGWGNMARPVTGQTGPGTALQAAFDGAAPAFAARHVGHYLAVFFDGALLTAPNISQPIPNGTAEITGKSLAEARRTAEVLNTGSLGVKLKVISVKRI